MFSHSPSRQHASVMRSAALVTESRSCDDECDQRIGLKQHGIWCAYQVHSHKARVRKSETPEEMLKRDHPQASVNDGCRG